MEKIRLYEVDGEESEVFKISIVEEPAVDSTMVYLSEQKKYISLESDEKRMVYSCALRPNFPIYRYDESCGEYYIKFTKEAVEKLSRKFLTNGYQASWSVDHKTDVDGITVTESWLKTDMNYDKSIALGLDKDLPIGTWFVGAHISNDEVWASVKEGKWGGFSVEAFCDLVEVNKFNKISKEDMNTEMLESVEVNDSFWDKLKAIIADALGGDKETAEEVVEEAKEETVDEEPKEEEMAAETTEMPTEEPKEEEIVEEVVEEVVAVVEETSEDPKEDLQAIVDELQAKVDALATENEELKKANEKLSKQPSVKKVSVEASVQTQNGVTSEGRAFLDALYGGRIRI